MPYLGLCLGLQCGVIEFARDVVGERDANSTEFDLFTDAPVIDLMPDQREVEDKGGSMRLGLYPARLTAGSRAEAAYGTEIIYERHRHRFEVNNQYRDALESAGMLISGSRPTVGWWRSWSCATIPGSWPASSTPSSRAVPTGRIRCSAPSCVPRCRVRAGPTGIGISADDTAATRQPVQVVTVEPAH